MSYEPTNLSEQSIVAIVVALIGALAAIAVAGMNGAWASKKSKAKTQVRRRTAPKVESPLATPSFERAIVRLLIVIIYGAAGFFGLTAVLAFSDRAYLTDAGLIVSALTFSLSAHFMEEALPPRHN